MIDPDNVPIVESEEMLARYVLQSSHIRRSDQTLKRDKANLDIFWLKDKSLEDSEDLPDPDLLAQEIADDLQTALDQFQAFGGELRD